MKKMRKTHFMTQGTKILHIEAWVIRTRMSKNRTRFLWEGAYRWLVKLGSKFGELFMWKPMAEVRKVILSSLKRRVLHFLGGRELKSNAFDKISQKQVHGNRWRSSCKASSYQLIYTVAIHIYTKWTYLIEIEIEKKH